MKMVLLAVAIMLAAPAAAVSPVATQQVELYRIAPGQHEAFLRFIARCDDVNRAAGVAPRQLFVHSDGAEWDFMLLQPAHYTAAEQARIDAAWDKLGMPSGADFFLAIRRFIATHTDTTVRGPTTAADYLATVASK